MVSSSSKRSEKFHKESSSARPGHSLGWREMEGKTIPDRVTAWAELWGWQITRPVWGASRVTEPQEASIYVDLNLFKNAYLILFKYVYLTFFSYLVITKIARRILHNTRESGISAFHGQFWSDSLDTCQVVVKCVWVSYLRRSSYNSKCMQNFYLLI
jgi:hypothetical protein